ncbi:hypothetical protein FA09DRAFT_358451 [Tilletiopsis washingtonensis]|jgi:gamma-glutamylcyclotransferase (GGCT)/AIG2-like uncharacterized protein YtfP|uniref:Gamma-glutamylcyclotransferase AIG2-like domain-containing protein n=1 Tax=Tilletiopsis washingtonensis TaxID=58919 RepID=A0A316ZJB9_9BASI|nr:hypothetical protein FA09DRAFT_358451 [Tilletiopsis washingtonensis]PWO00364.1 hypothetical protein FA09DRAFT_358451 [Tilletiopsis washingtonensis]
MPTDTNKADCRLATYGTLAPGRPNAHQLEGLHGTWSSGTVRGHLVERGWGAPLGYPAMIPDAEKGAQIAVSLFESHELPAHWARLDAFEGSGYARVAVPVMTAAGPTRAFIYIDKAE